MSNDLTDEIAHILDADPDELRAQTGAPWEHVQPTGTIPTISDIADSAVNRLAGQVAARKDSHYRSAILGTDWDETAVVRIIHHCPSIDTPFDPADGSYTIDHGTIEVERYPDRAPPISAHASDDPTVLTEVTTVTRPLLDALADEANEIDELVDTIRLIEGDRP